MIFTKHLSLKLIFSLSFIFLLTVFVGFFYSQDLVIFAQENSTNSYDTLNKLNLFGHKADFSLISVLGRILFVLVLISVYWFVLDKFRKSLKTIIPDNFKIRLVTDLSVTIGTVVLSFLTISLVFADSLNAFLTGIGLISTALVFTLQDFVASFFGWLHIRIGHLYTSGDDITLHTNTAKYSGRVLHIGIFRTVIKVRLGDDTLDNEQPTGRTVSFPNHLVLKDSVDNSTLNNKILWHAMNYTVTMESDTDLTKKIIQKICDKQFQFALDHDHIHDNSQNKKTIYKPKIYLDIAPEGKRFTVWFACNLGFYRETVNHYSFDILREFENNNIHFAYPTQRIVLDK